MKWVNAHKRTENGAWHMENAQKLLVLLLWFITLLACWKTIFPRLHRPLLPTYSSLSFDWDWWCLNFSGLWNAGVQEGKWSQGSSLYQYSNHSLNWAAGVTLQGGLPRGNCRFVPDLRHGPQMIGNASRGPREPAGLADYPEKTAASGQAIPPVLIWPARELNSL